MKWISVEKWLHGLLAMFIGGGATTLSASGFMAIAHQADASIPILNWKAMGIVFLAGGVSNAVAYLKQSPLPPEE